MVGQNVKRIVVTAGATGIIAAMAAFPTIANAQTTYTVMPRTATVTRPVVTYPVYGYGGVGYNPVSQWIVLSSLFSPGYLYGGGIL